jgi:hypothetical protein
MSKYWFDKTWTYDEVVNLAQTKYQRGPMLEIIYDRVINLILHRINCVECQYNLYLCRDGQKEGVVEAIEIAYLGSPLDTLINGWANEADDPDD